jgi:hypothetical protein
MSTIFSLSHFKITHSSDLGDSKHGIGDAITGEAIVLGSDRPVDVSIVAGLLCYKGYYGKDERYFDKFGGRIYEDEPSLRYGKRLGQGYKHVVLT